MKDFRDRVALITGAANGFGHEFVKEAARRGMRIAAFDIEEAEVKAVTQEATDLGAADIFAEKCDVTKYEDVKKAVQETMDRYGRIDLLMNNAGIAVLGEIWNVPVQDFEWTIHANTMSHVYFMHEVIPIMKKQGTHCNICNTCSVAGLITADGMAAYYMSKHAAVGLAEATSYDLQTEGDDIAVSVFCPGFVQTDLHHCERHRVAPYDQDDPYYHTATFRKWQKVGETEILTGMPIDAIGMRVFQDIEEDKFYITTDPMYTTLIGKRVQNIVNGKNPSLRALHNF